LDIEENIAQGLSLLSVASTPIINTTQVLINMSWGKFMSRINSQVMVTIQQFTGIMPNDTKASAYARKVAVENMLHFLWNLICVIFLCVFTCT